MAREGAAAAPARQKPYLEDVLQLPEHCVHLVVQQPAELLLLRGQAGRQPPGPAVPSPASPRPRASPAPLAPLPSLTSRSPSPPLSNGPWPAVRWRLGPPAVSAPAAPGPSPAADWLRARPPRSGPLPRLRPAELALQIEAGDCANPLAPALPSGRRHLPGALGARAPHPPPLSEWSAAAACPSPPRL